MVLLSCRSKILCAALVTLPACDDDEYMVTLEDQPFSGCSPFDCFERKDFRERNRENT